MRTMIWGRAASLLLGLEGIALAVVVLGQIAALVTGGASVFDSGIALIVLSALGAAGLFAFAAAVWRGRSWGRSGGVVVQLLILAVAGGAVTGLYAHPVIGLALAVPAFAALVLLTLAAREAHRAQDDDRPERE